MRTAFTELVGVRHPVVAFSHTPAVVAAVSRAGGLGVFGAQRFSADELEEALAWLDVNVDDQPYGVDVLFPATYTDGTEDELRKLIPEGHRRFVEDLKVRFEIPEPTSSSRHHEFGGQIVTQNGVLDLVEVSLRHRTSVLVSALGPLPRDTIARARGQGVTVGGLVNVARHGVKHLEAGAEFLVAQGTEAAGHTGDLATMVTVPEIVDVAAPAPVLAAGGIATGRQFAAALALGAAGVWCGSVWLATDESDLPEVVKDKVVRATSRDTIRSRTTTGKPTRILRSLWTEAWAAPGAPEPLDAPLQGLLTADAMAGIYQGNVEPLMSSIVGQAIGQVRERQTCQQVLETLVQEATRTAGDIAALVNS